MKLAIALLSIAAVAFWLRFLVALRLEGTHLSRRTVDFYVAKFNPSPRQGLIVMTRGMSKSKTSTKTNGRIAV